MNKSHGEKQNEILRMFFYSGTEETAFNFANVIVMFILLGWSHLWYSVFPYVADYMWGVTE